MRLRTITFKTAAALTLAGLAGPALANDTETVASRKERALASCTAEASARYNGAEVGTKLKRKSLGRKKGYAVSVNVGAGKRVSCVAMDDGEILFTSRR
ncbi:MAG: hypothetical protein AAF648_09630 [Pseudomonadota bacterium]